MKKAVVILGAGASFDVHNGTVPVSNPNLRPPLARQLFEDRFWQWRSYYDGVKVLGAELGRMALSQDAPFNLEERLTEYANSSDYRTQRAFRDIPPYLRDVMLAVSGSYVPSPTSYIVLIRRLLHDESHEIMFISLNYDTLLESALIPYDRNLVFSDLDDYISTNRQARIVKVHGSTNWGIPIPGTGNQDSPRLNWQDAVEQFEPLEQSSNLIIVNNTAQMTQEWHGGEEGRFLYPRLTAPMLDKTFSCPDGHTEALKDFMGECHKFLIIGTSGLDQDLLECMAEACAGRGHVVYYVNSGDAVEQTRKRFEDSVKAFRLSGPQTPMPHTSAHGFTSFLDTTELEAFLGAD